MSEVSALIGKPWKKPPFIQRPWLRWLLIVGFVAYLIAAFSTIEVNWSRVYAGLERGEKFILAFTQPDFTSRSSDIWEGMIESIVMTVASSVVGIAISIPIALGAARNVAPLPVYLICRSIIAISRALQEIIVAILLVAIFGFGPLAGFLTLSFGFLAKLLAEDIESMDKVQAEAIKASGAKWTQWINYGVQPQVMPRLIGLSIYRIDINFRESAILGLVGAGGIGATLNTAFDRYEYDTAAAILLIIIVIVMALEYLSGVIRARVQ